MLDLSAWQVLTVGLALSGWGKVAFDYWTALPRIRGSTFLVIHGQMPVPGGGVAMSFVPYVYLTNASKSPVHMLDYELQVFARGEWHRLTRIYGLRTDATYSFLDQAGNQIAMRNFGENLLYLRAEPVSFGTPLRGWLLFAGPLSLYGANITEYHLTCIDAFKRRHDIRTRPEEFVEFNLVRELAGIDIAPTALPGN